MNLRTLLPLVLFSFTFNHIEAQSYSISGYVKDQNNGNALVGANVFIEGNFHYYIL